MQSLDTIKEAVKSLHDIDVLERCRKRVCVFPRQLFCYVAVRSYGYSMRKVGDYLGFNPTTVGHHVKLIGWAAKHDEIVRAKIERILTEIENKK